MVLQFLLALSLPPLLLLGWVGVQHAWRRQFSSSDDDALVERNDCSHCGCMSGCNENE